MKKISQSVIKAVCFVSLVALLTVPVYFLSYTISKRGLSEQKSAITQTIANSVGVNLDFWRGRKIEFATMETSGDERSLPADGYMHCEQDRVVFSVPRSSELMVNPNEQFIKFDDKDGQVSFYDRTYFERDMSYQLNAEIAMILNAAKQSCDAELIFKKKMLSVVFALYAGQKNVPLQTSDMLVLLDFDEYGKINHMKSRELLNIYPGENLERITDILAVEARKMANTGV